METYHGKVYSFALAGNPNCGKTTLFNSLTGSTAYVGNWPGVTVEKREGTYKKEGIGRATIVDLPGIYSLSPYTPEEVISRNYILENHPDCVINVIDATNLERNLYMTTQILEMDVPVVLALNMMDAVKNSGMSIDCEGLSRKLGIPVVPISALRYENLDLLMKKAIAAAEKKRTGLSLWAYKELKEPIDKAVGIYRAAEIENPLFHALKALEGDDLEKSKNPVAYQDVEKLNVPSEDFEAKSADYRYQYITSELAPFRKGAPTQESKKMSRSDKIDKVLTNKWLGIPILIVLLFLIFHFTFAGDLFYMNAMGLKIGTYAGAIHWTMDGQDFHPFIGLFYDDGGIVSIGEFFHRLIGDGGYGFTEEGGTDGNPGLLGMLNAGVHMGLEASGAPEWLNGFLCDGVLAGVFAVLGFVPQILVLFFFFSVLEDSGYMARIAFVLDRIFRRFGVSGRAFLPMIMGFGCGVPAMINTRTLATDKERTKTIRVIPFFTCGAKAEFLAVIAAAVADAVGFDAGLFTFLVYLFGVVLAIAMVILMNQTTQREKVPPFIMELPPYHVPQAHALLLHVWDKGKHFIKKAFTIILLSTVAVWFLASFTPNWVFIASAEESLGLTEADSILAHIGMIIAPLFTPMGFGNVQGGNAAWTYAVASLQGIVAKENVTATLETLAGIVGGNSLADIVAYSNATGGHMDAASLTAFAVFNMTTIPCFASVATAKGELSDRKSYLGTIAFWLLVSYVCGCLTYVTFEWPVSLAGTLPAIVLLFTGAYFYNRRKNDAESKAAKAN